jgi:hypothetical protein
MKDNKKNSKELKHEQEKRYKVLKSEFLSNSITLEKLNNKQDKRRNILKNASRVTLFGASLSVGLIAMLAFGLIEPTFLAIGVISGVVTPISVELLTYKKYANIEDKVIPKIKHEQRNLEQILNKNIDNNISKTEKLTKKDLEDEFAPTKEQLKEVSKMNVKDIITKKQVKISDKQHIEDELQK